MNHKGRRVAIVLTVLGIATILAAGVAMKKSILERWYIHRLQKEHDWRTLSERLGELRSEEAMVFFLEVMGRADQRSESGKRLSREEDDIFEGAGFSLFTMTEKMGRTEFCALLEKIALDLRRGTAARKRAHRKLLAGEDETRDFAVRACRGLLEDPDPDVRRAAADALEKSSGRRDPAQHPLPHFPRRSSVGDLSRIAYASTLEFLRAHFPGLGDAVPAMVIAPQSYGSLLNHTRTCIPSSPSASSTAGARSIPHPATSTSSPWRRSSAGRRSG